MSSSVVFSSSSLCAISFAQISSFTISCRLLRERKKNQNWKYQNETLFHHKNQKRIICKYFIFVELRDNFFLFIEEEEFLVHFALVKFRSLLRMRTIYYFRCFFGWIISIGFSLKNLKIISIAWDSCCCNIPRFLFESNCSIRIDQWKCKSW